MFDMVTKQNNTTDLLHYIQIIFIPKQCKQYSLYAETPGTLPADEGAISTMATPILVTHGQNMHRNQAKSTLDER